MYTPQLRSVASAPEIRPIDLVPDERTFYNTYFSFNRRQRRYHISLPTICGVSVNLFKLFTAVVQRGGYAKVTEKHLWEAVSKEVGCPSACANYCVALRRIYSQYLIAYEHDSFPSLKDESLWLQLQDEFHESGGDKVIPPSVEKILGIFNPRPAPIHYGIHRSSTHHSFFNRDMLPNARSNQDVHRISSAYDHLPPSLQLEELHSRPHPSNAFDLRHLSVLETAERSLMSGLPNEVDLSLNSILFLSAIVQHSPATPLRFSSSRNLLQLLLATVGIYEDGPLSLRSLSETWRISSQLEFEKFWEDIVDHEIYLSLREDALLYKEHSEPLVHNAETVGYRVVPPPSPDSTHNLFSPSASTSQHFASSGINECGGSHACLARALTVATTLVNSVTPPFVLGLSPALDEDDDEFEQVVAFASVSDRRSSCIGAGGRPFRGRSLFPSPLTVPPLSTWRDNARFLSSHPIAIRFAFFCAYARHSCLRQLGLQLVGSLRYLILPPPPVLTRPTPPNLLHLNTFTGVELLSIRFLIRCLIQSSDRCDLVSGLHLLNNLLRVPEGVNMERLFAGLPRTIWGRLIQLLCLSDLGVVCAVLEALYTATGMGGLACNRLWHALASSDDTTSECEPATVFAARRASIHLRPLVALLSLEGQSMGTESLHRVKVMQRHPQPIISQAPHPSVLQPPTSPHPTMFAPQSVHPSYLQVQQPTYQSPVPHVPVQHFPSTVHHPAHRYPPLMPSRPSFLPPRAFSPHPPSSLANLLGSATPSRLQPPAICVPPQVANVKPEASSISELTDRLQMPPPQLPPPRRTPAKLAPCGNNGNSPIRSPVVNGNVMPQVPAPPNHQSDKQSKSLLEEVLNAPSSPLVTKLSGQPMLNGSGQVPHVTGGNGIKKELLSMCQTGKLLNGVTTPIKRLQEQVKSKTFPLMNGTPIESEEKKLNSFGLSEDSDDVDEHMGKKFQESANVLTHFLCFNRRVGFYYTRKRPRDYALRCRFPKDASVDLPPVKSRKYLTVERMQLQNTASTAAPPSPPKPVFTCEWGLCLMQFPTAKQVSCHVYRTHLMPDRSVNLSASPIERRCCEWADCNSSHLPRAPLALVSHVIEWHCSPDELETRRRSQGVSSVQPKPPSPYHHVAGPPAKDQSGLAIIKEVETRRLQSDLYMSQISLNGKYHHPAMGRVIPPPREGPVTKHLRVTAALILRNLVTHVPAAREWLLSETPLLCEIAMGTSPGSSSLRTNDAGRIIAHCLAICNSGSSFTISSSSSSGLHELMDATSSNEGEDMFGATSEVQRRPFLRQRTSVDLDA